MTAADAVSVHAEPHTTVIIAGAGISGICALVQLKRLAGVTDVAVYEKAGELGGTWQANRYPGASCDIPIALYSYSFEPAKEFNTQWPGSEGICAYYNRIVDKYAVRPSLIFHTVVESASFSRQTGLWTVKIRNVSTGETRTRTCNVFISAVGALSTPADAPFDVSEYEGKVMHSAEWDDSVSLKDKDVVVLGNGCSAAQLAPAILLEVKSLTQIARAKHCIVPPSWFPDTALTGALLRYVPGLHTAFRSYVLNYMEAFFELTDKDKGAKGRAEIKKFSEKYIDKAAPAKFRDQLKYDFEFGQKRRVIDFSRYVPALHSPKFDLLLPDTIVSAKGRTVTTQSGKEVKADVVVLSTGFKVTDYLFPLKVYNNEGESLVERLKGNGLKTYLTSMVAGYPNFFILMGPNSVTGHSSVLWNTESTVLLLLALLKPVFAALSTNKPADVGPAPTVEVTQEAEDGWYGRMRAEMGKRVWEMDGGISWYVDPQQGKCTTLFPWGQPEFKRQTQEAASAKKKGDFIWTGC
ncbi:hypothetical protein JCM8097_003561 [Rhodosporidiobolus ruineniae]